MKTDLLNNEILSTFDFSKTYIGFVVDNSDFEFVKCIKVFIPSLFGYNYNTGYDIIEQDLSITNNHIVNRNEINAKTNLKKVNYIKVKPLVTNGLEFNKGFFINFHKPMVGTKVMVTFLNGNPLNPYYENGHIWGDDEFINFDN